MLMSKRSITFEIDESIVASLIKRFPDITDVDTLLSTLARLALTEWDLWFSAQLRPRTVSALTQERVKMIFDDPVLYKDRQVTRQLLYNQFNLPYGEASYVERVFGDRDTPSL